MLPASLAAWVPVFMATPRSAWASAGASLVPSPIIATSRPPACSLRMYGQLRLGRGLGDVVVDAGLLGDGLRGQRVVAGHHHGANAHLPEPFEAVPDAGLQNVFEHHHADDAVPLGDQRAASPPAPATAFTCSSSNERRRCHPSAWTCFTTASDAPLRMHAAVRQVDAAHAGLRGERDELATPAAARPRRAPGVRRYNSTMLLPSGVSSAALASAARSPTSAGREVPSGTKLGRLAVAERDRAGLVEQQRVDVAGHLDGLPALGDQVCPQCPVHAGDADGGEQRADRRRNQADEQRDQRRDVGAEALEPGGPR